MLKRHKVIESIYTWYIMIKRNGDVLPYTHEERVLRTNKIWADKFSIKNDKENFEKVMHLCFESAN